MEAVRLAHSALGPALLGALLVLAVAAIAALLRGGEPAWLETGRRIALALLVAQAALGLALAARGAAPSETIHWLYGAAVIAVLLVPGALRRLGPVMAAASGVAVLLAWRLWASG